MKAKPIIVAVAAAVSILFLTAPLHASAASDSIEVSPDWLRISGEPGTLQNETVTLNNPYADSVTVSVDTPDSLPVEIQSSIRLSPGVNHVPVIVPDMTDSYTYGYVTFNWTWEGEDMTREWLVLLLPEAPTARDVDVSLISRDVSSGDTVMYTFDDINGEWVTGVGYVVIPESNAQYQVDVSYGWASVSLSNDDSGPAVAYFRGEKPEPFKAKVTFNITGEGMEPTGLQISAASSVSLDASKTISVTYNDEPLTDVYVDVMPPSGGTFYKKTDSNGAIQVSFDETGTWDIQVSYQGYNETVSVTVEDNGGNGDGDDDDDGDASVSIDAPGSVTVGSSEWITLNVNGDTLANHPINIRTPEGAIEPYSTNSMGQLRYTFSDVGDYRLSASYHNNSDSKDISVSRAAMDIEAPDEAMVNTPVSLDVEQGSSVTIEGPAGKTSDTASGSTYTFTPAQLGTYTVKAESMTSSGQTSFRVYGKPSIRVFDMQGNHVANAVKGEIYTVSVTYDGDTVDTEITVSMPSGFTETLNNTNTWKPRQAGRHTVTAEKTGYYKAASVPVSVVRGDGGGGVNMMVTGAMVLLIAAAVLFFTRNKWIPKIQEWRSDREKKQEAAEQPEREYPE